MQIIPSIDILYGKCVKLVQGKPGTGITVSDNPVEIVDFWEGEGAEMLHVVDLDAAIFGSKRNRDIIKRILERASVPVEVGGGIRTVEDAISLLNIGAKWIIMGTALLEKPDFMREILRSVEPSRLIVALELKNTKLLIKGWTDEIRHSAYDVIKKFEPFKISAFLYTDVRVEGTLGGVRLENVSKTVKSSRIPILYSGGVSTKEDVLNLKAVGVKGVIIGRALYDRRLKLKEIMDLVRNAQCKS